MTESGWPSVGLLGQPHRGGLPHHSLLKKVSHRIEHLSEFSLVVFNRILNIQEWRILMNFKGPLEEEPKSTGEEELNKNPKICLN